MNKQINQEIKQVSGCQGTEFWWGKWGVITDMGIFFRCVENVLKLERSGSCTTV